MKSKYSKLLAIYDRLPKIDCKGLCHESCTIAPAAKIEIRRAKEMSVSARLFSQHDIANNIDGILKDGIPTCKALKSGRCSIYRNRPLICRLFGVAEGMECEFGCVPDRVISKIEAEAMFEEIKEL